MTAGHAPVSAIVVDDEPLGRERVSMFVSARHDIRLLAECADGHTAIHTIRALKPDIVFLDVQMPGMDGLEVVRMIGPDHMPATIFITAYDEHAIEAFEVHALDYLLKPFRPDRFKEAVDRVIDIVRKGKKSSRALGRLLEDGREGLIDRILVKSSRRAYFVRVSQIEWIEAAGNYLKLHIGDRVHLIRQTMSRLERQLDPKEFVRIHRSAIVNLNAVRELQRADGGEYEVVLERGERLRLSRGYRDELKRFDPLKSQTEH
jgi:two-component system LytT family response regulator